MNNISIVILNWNGLIFLKECIPSVISACRDYTDNCEIIVVDNGSSDGSIDYLQSAFPQVKIIPLKANLGFAKAMNIGIKESRYPIVIGLNNDIIVDEGFILPLVSHFPGDGNILAVAAKMLLWDKKTLNFGRAKGDFQFGFFKRNIVDSPVAVNTLYACAGGFAVDKNKFIELGGFDEDMDVYWEDADLCYRAWKKGWKTVYEPRSIIYHKFHGTYSKKCGRGWIDKASGQNYILFVLKNIHDKVFFCEQLFSLPVLMLVSVLTDKPHFALGLFLSLKRWPLFFKKRHIEKNKATLSDRSVFRISAQ